MRRYRPATVPGFVLNNVTIARNTADSDGDGTGNAAVHLQRDSLTTSMTLRNTIMAANEDGSPGSGDVPDCEVQGGATITAASYDLIGKRERLQPHDSRRRAGHPRR